MNDVLQLKGRFEQKSKDGNIGARNIPKGKVIALDHLSRLKNHLVAVYDYWKGDTILNDKLVSAYYIGIIAKSNRIQSLLHTKQEAIVGSKFTEGEKRRHIITHCVSMETIQKSIEKLEVCILLCKARTIPHLSYDDINTINSNQSGIVFSTISKTSFVSTIVDAYYVERFDVDAAKSDIHESSLISLYHTGISTAELLRRLKIDVPQRKNLDETTVLLTKDQYDVLKERAPYLIAMAVTDMTSIATDSIGLDIDEHCSIPEPQNEATIGVIDTLFDERVYFSKWVQFSNMVDKNIPIEPHDYDHGTRVSSIIVDGPALNPDLDDGCGRFKVRHFGVAAGGMFSSFTILHNIKEIIATNKDIKVWNLSLGSTLPVNDNFISPEAAILDQIQFENDVIFVIAGTNKVQSQMESLKIGAPADSINSLVVNSVDFQNKPASYSREGPVLSFFNKPDVSYYGGDSDKPIKTFAPFGESFVEGTSFAAPWIARKLAYLINVIGLSRELAKALIIDSAAAWDLSPNPSHISGYGVVPKKIENIIHSQTDEIRFVISGISEKYDTYNFNIPVPIYKEQQPFIAKATLCYFPKCSRNQGVDYTNTELDLHFGRVTDTGIKTINDNNQSEEKLMYLTEEDARTYYRKWDTVKHIGETLTKKKRSKKIYNNGAWGISIKTKARLAVGDGKGINFGAVVTLKEINGENRIEDFIKQCSLKGWLVNRINVKAQVDIYNKAEEEIEFEE